MSTARFLIADDTVGKQFYLRALLKKSKFAADVVTAASTKESAKVIEQTPNIVAAFVDYRMPEAGGIPVIDLLRKRNPSARIALITASTGDALEREAGAAGADTAISTAYPEKYVTEEILKLLDEWKNLR
jgi:CheY-like chemotaxis protein